MNIETLVLEKLQELGQSRGGFKIEQDPNNLGYYNIRIGTNCYTTDMFTQERLFNALVCIQTGIAIDEKWYNK